MKRKTISAILCLLLLLSLSVSVSADTLPRVVDNADVLTESEEVNLTARAETIICDWQIDAVIVTVDSLDGKTVQEYADDYYDEHGYGCGVDYSGILFLLSMGTREWYMSTCGEAIYIFTDYGLAQMEEKIIPHLSDGRYFEAFDTWLYLVEQYCETYQTSGPVDGYAPPDEYYPDSGDEIIYYPTETKPNHFISLVIGAVVALVVILIMRSQMNTAKKQSGAVDYLNQGSFHLRTSRDLFLYSRVTKTRRSENKSGGGSSVHRSSGGRSHGGRGGRF